MRTQNQNDSSRNPSDAAKLEDLFVVMKRLEEVEARTALIVESPVEQHHTLSDAQRKMLTDALDGKRKAIKAVRRDFKSREAATVALLEARATGNDPHLKALGDLDEAERALASAESRGLIRIKGGDKKAKWTNMEIAGAVVVSTVVVAAAAAGGYYFATQM